MNRSNSFPHQRCFAKTVATKPLSSASGRQRDVRERVVSFGNHACNLRSMRASHNWECNMVVRVTIRNCSCATKSALHLVAVEFRICHSSAAELRRRLTVDYSTPQRLHSHWSNIIFFAKVELPSYFFVAPSRTFVWRTGPHVSDTRFTIA